MGYSRENVQKVKAMLEERRANAVARSERNIREVSAKSPRLDAVLTALSATGIRIMQAVFQHRADENTLAEIRRENEKLRQEKASLLVSLGYPADYTDIHYTCPHCCDTGYVGIQMCSCMRELLARTGLESAGLLSLSKSQSFSTFSLAFYEKYDRMYMEKNVEQLRRFSETFDEHTTQNYLLTGPTGLGKTHLSTAVAHVVIERGYTVFYDTVQEILAVFEEERFSHGQGAQHEKGRSAESILDCDLLILDDLGTEMQNAFSLSCLYNIINTRINRGRPTIINTNLTQAELRAQYSDRITSRLFGEYRPLLFQGRDVRMQKIVQKQNP